MSKDEATEASTTDMVNPSKPVKLTIPEMVLLAADTLPSQFTTSAIVVAAWTDYPQTFGLEGHTNHPDSNKVLVNLLGKRGLVARGWLVRVAPKTYAVGGEGRKRIDQLTGKRPAGQNGKLSHTTPVASTVKLTQDQELFLRRLDDSMVYRKTAAGRKTEVTFTDACNLWGIDETLTRREFDSTLEQFDKHLAAIGKAIEVGGGSWTAGSGQVITVGDVRGAEQCE